MELTVGTELFKRRPRLPESIPPAPRRVPARLVLPGSGDGCQAIHGSGTLPVTMKDCM